MTGAGLPVAVIGILMGLWLVAATVAIWHGLSLRHQAKRMLRQTSRLGRLLETAPAMPIVVKGDGRLEASDRFSRQLGLDRPALVLADLGGLDDAGLEPESLQLLDAHVRETQRTGKDFTLQLAVRGSDRRMLVKGGIADAVIYPNGAALLWFFDSTELLRELEKRTSESEEARRAFEALAGLIEAAPMPMWHRGPDMRLNFVNRAYVDAVGGLDGTQVVEQEIELVEPVGNKSAADMAAEAQSLGERSERTVSSTLGGARRQMRVYDIPLGETGVAGLALDIQELSDARNESRRLSDAQRDLLNLMSAGVAKFDSEHVLDFANLPFQRIFNFRDQWLAEKPEFARVLDRMRENAKLPEVRDFPAWRGERENWFRTAEASEENWLLPDGTHLRVLAQPEPDGGLLLIFEDRTEQAQLASARDTLLRVRTATFDNLFEAVAVFAADGRISIWNRLFSEIWGMTDDVLTRHPRVDELLPQLANYLRKPSQISIVGELLRMTTVAREQRRTKVTFADGRVFQVAAIPLPDGNALFTMLDITDSAQVEQALRDRNEALSEADSIKASFLANMSYEFRTPLTSIAGFADLLRTGVAGDLNEQAKDYVEAIASSAERLSEQINTVLDYSQGEAGALPLAREPVEVASALQAIVQAKQDFADSKDVALDVQFPDKSLTVSADAKRLSQAIGHVLDNAIRYHRPGGKVLIFARQNRKNAEIIISDDGAGIPVKEQAALFDGFGRSVKQSGTDHGLGLPLARQLIEAHGGELRLESEPGQGTTVLMALPCV